MKITFGCYPGDDAVEKALKWHKWFAWHPVTVHSKTGKSSGTVWLQTVWRRASEASWDGYGGFIWIYADDVVDVVVDKFETR